jgi:RiboL-PSP-HEPN
MSRRPYSDKDAVKFAADQIKDFYLVSLDRIDALMEHSKALRAKGEKELASDILRAAVVLLHATLEDFLRSVEDRLLPYCGEDALKDVPLIGQGKNAKLHLGNLAAHRGKSVLDVIQDSVKEYLDKKTYNNIPTIENLLKKLGIDPSAVSSLHPPIGRLITRRHQIVHRGDKQNGKLKPISPEQVEKWIKAVADFVGDICAEIPESPGAKGVPE